MTSQTAAMCSPCAAGYFGRVAGLIASTCSRKCNAGSFCQLFQFCAVSLQLWSIRECHWCYILVLFGSVRPWIFSNAGSTTSYQFDCFSGHFGTTRGTHQQAFVSFSHTYIYAHTCPHSHYHRHSRRKCSHVCVCVCQRGINGSVT